MGRIAPFWLLAILVLGLGAGGASGSAGGFTVAFVTDIGASPSPHDLRGVAYLGFVRAVKDFRVRGRAVQYNPKLGVEGTLSALARQRYDLVFTGLSTVDTSQYAAAVTAVATKYPETRFVMHDVPYELLGGRPKNVEGTVWHVEEPAFLAGYLAASLERRRHGRDVIGSVGGFPIPPVQTFIAGYEAGARYADPKIVVLRSYAYDFLDPAKCKAVAKAAIARGAGTVLNVAGACGLGTLEAAKEARVWAIGVDVDQSFLGAQVLTSVLKRWDVEVYETVKALVDGKLRTGGDTVWHLRSGAVGLGRISPKVPHSLIAEMEHVRAKIVAGKIRVPSTIR